MNWKRSAFPAMLLFALAFYARSFNGYFVADDYEFAGKIDFRSASQYLFKQFGYNEYRPLVPLTFAVDEAIGRDSPIPFHVTNTLLQFANACVLFSIALAIGLPRRAAWFAFAAFLLNPLAHEPLLWISGRPVLLCTLLVLVSVRLFLENRKAALAGVVGFFVLALGTYEGALVLPFALAALWALPRYRSRRRLTTLLITFGIAGVYVFLWMRLFDNHIVRFPVERSVVGMAWNLSQALLSSVHGSARVFPGALYVALLLGFCRTSRGLKVTAYLLAMFAIGYLPFLLVHGFANRFAYGSSAAAAIWLAYALADLRQTRFAALSAPAISVLRSRNAKPDYLVEPRR